MSQRIILYDITGSIPGKAWSPNTWNTRYTLNYKQIPFEVIWVDYPDIEAVCKRIGAKPTATKPDGRDHYTFPVIVDPSTEAVVSDSFNIALYLDATYPKTPRVIPQGAEMLQAAFFHGFVLNQLTMPTFAPLIVAEWDHLAGRGRTWFRETREAAYGELEEVAGLKDRVKRERLWRAAEKGWESLAEWWVLQGDGPFAMGDILSFADIAIAGLMTWILTICGEDSSDWKRVESWSGGRWKGLLQQFERYQSDGRA
ncbi:hypothetical protein K474DRAFT_1598958 [Panus rudis PR-1116 ss-1]|nr:hypothetical protein K474DRAFT_1598958 [Panus rudis PR-1116 ss-1]